MPLYDFLDMESNEVFEALFKFAEKDEFLKENPSFSALHDYHGQLRLRDRKPQLAMIMIAS